MGCLEVLQGKPNGLVVALLVFKVFFDSVGLMQEGRSFIIIPFFFPT